MVALNNLNGVEAKSQEHAEEYYSAFVKGGIDAYVKKKLLAKTKRRNFTLIRVEDGSIITMCSKKCMVHNHLLFAWFVMQLKY